MTEHESDRMGVVGVVRELRDLEFPASADEIRERAGDRRVRPSKRLELTVSEILDHLPEREFATLGDLETALLKHWQGIRFLEVPEEQRSPEGGFQPTQRPGWPHTAGREAQGLRHARGEDKPWEGER